MTNPGRFRGRVAGAARHNRAAAGQAAADARKAASSAAHWSTWLRRGALGVGSAAVFLLGLVSANVPVSSKLTPWVYDDPCLAYYNAANGLLQRGMDEAVKDLDRPPGEKCRAPSSLVNDWRQDNDPCLGYYNAANGLLQRGLEKAVLNLDPPRRCDTPEQLLADWREDNPPPAGPEERPCCPTPPPSACPAAPTDCPGEGGHVEDPPCPGAPTTSS